MPDDQKAALNSAATAKDIEKRVKETSESLKRVHAEVSKVILGQDDFIKKMLTCIVSGGHFLAEGVPGTGKTMSVKAMAKVLGLSWGRVQFTPDLMPADILGHEILQSDGMTRFKEGPIFTQLLLADELNRGNPKTQSALLEAMQEKGVTIAGHTRTLPSPFLVMATQNPKEQAGTYDLTEAATDRFLMKLHMSYPDEETELRIATDTESDAAKIGRLSAIFNEATLLETQELARNLPVSDEVARTVVRIVRATRPEQNSRAENLVAQGAGTRAAMAFIRAAKSYALIEGRLSPNENDIHAVLQPILEHRMALEYGANYKDAMKKLLLQI